MMHLRPKCMQLGDGWRWWMRIGETEKRPEASGCGKLESGKLINPVLTGLDGAETAGVSECNSPATLNPRFFQ